MPKTNTNKKPKAAKAQKITQRTVTDWIFQNYEVTLLPKYFYMNLSKIAKGEYKGLAKPVPWADLLDMWQRKWSYLEKVHIKNEQQGKHLEGMARINYDLAIVLSKYDSYLSWKAECEAEQKLKKQEQQMQINYSCINNGNPNNLLSNNDSLDDVLNDLWSDNDGS